MILPKEIEKNGNEIALCIGRIIKNTYRQVRATRPALELTKLARFFSTMPKRVNACCRIGVKR